MTDDLNGLPKIYLYDDFVAFLSDYVGQRKRQQSWFSARWLSKRAGIASPALLSMMMNRQRGLSLPFVERISSALGLSPAEIRFAVLLTERALGRSDVIVDLVEREMDHIAAVEGWSKRVNRHIGRAAIVRSITVTTGSLRQES